MKRSAGVPCCGVEDTGGHPPGSSSTTAPPAVKQVKVEIPPDFKTKPDFIQYYRHLTLDPNTAYRELSLSQGNRRVELTDLVQSYPHRPERFTHLWQVLCQQRLSERSYWEVQWTGSIEIAVCYEDIGRSDYYSECAFGCNDKSWSLDLNSNNACFRHNDVETPVTEPQSSRVGVYLDPSAGVLAFYGISDDTVSLIHAVQTAFTQPLYPGLWVAEQAELLDLQ